MNLNYSKDQFFGFNNYQSVIAPQTNLEQSMTDLHMNVPYMTVQNATNQHYGNPPEAHAMMTQVSKPLVNMIVNSPDNFIVDQPIFHPTTFYYRPENDYHYYCIKISFDSVNNFDQNKCVFLYKRQGYNRIFQIVCEIVSPSFIINFLNKNIFGIEMDQNVGHEQQLSITFDQKENLKFYLKQYLDRYLLN